MKTSGVYSLIAQSAPPRDDIYDIVVLAPKESFLSMFSWSVIGLLLAAGIALALYFLLRKPARRAEKSAEERAYEKLKETQQERESLTTNEYALALSETLKNYLAERFEDTVRYETTPEFLHRVANKPSLFPLTAQQHLQSFLIRAEELKFGNASDSEKKADPLGKIAEQVVQLCQIVNETTSEASH
ncbi:MAG: hypothetical protein AAF733_04445 [Verrucomicrobiota bacterium]